MRKGVFKTIALKLFQLIKCSFYKCKRYKNKYENAYLHNILYRMRNNKKNRLKLFIEFASIFTFLPTI